MKVLTPLNGHVLVRPRKPAPAPAGIAIPDSVDKERETVGEIMIGNYIMKSDAGKTYVPVIQVKEGDTVLFSSLHPRKVMHDGEECLLIHGEDILAVIEA